MKTNHKTLVSLYRSLSETDQQTLFAFAEFLQARQSGVAVARVIPEPITISRPEKESVIGAIKRLSASYPMLDKAKMLDQTSALVAQNVMQGRAANELIDELELIFLRHFEKLKYESGLSS